MSDRARDVVRYVKAIEETGGYYTHYHFGVLSRLPSHDRCRADMLDLGELSDDEIMAGFARCGIVAPPIAQVRRRIGSYR